MTNFGFVGFGSMAKMIIRSLIEYAGINQNNIYVTRKIKERLCEVNDIFNNVIAVGNCQDIVSSARIVFICVKPVEVKSI